MRKYRRDLGRLELSPSEIRFTQDTVAMTFQDGNKLNELCEDIVKGTVQLKSIPVIRVLENNGIYYSVDNRRLYVLRVLEKLNFLTEITVRLISEHDRLVTTNNDGCHVTLRSQKDVNGKWITDATYLHCSCLRQRNRARKPVWWDEQRRCHKDQRNNRVVLETIQRPYRPAVKVTPERNVFKSYNYSTYRRPVIENRSTSNHPQLKNDEFPWGIFAVVAMGLFGLWLLSRGQ